MLNKSLKTPRRSFVSKKAHIIFKNKEESAINLTTKKPILNSSFIQTQQTMGQYEQKNDIQDSDGQISEDSSLGSQKMIHTFQQEMIQYIKNFNMQRQSQIKQFYQTFQQYKKDFIYLIKTETSAQILQTIEKKLGKQSQNFTQLIRLQEYIVGTDYITLQDIQREQQPLDHNLRLLQEESYYGDLLVLLLQDDKFELQDLINNRAVLCHLLWKNDKLQISGIENGHILKKKKYLLNLGSILWKKRILKSLDKLSNNRFKILQNIIIGNRKQYGQNDQERQNFLMNSQIYSYIRDTAYKEQLMNIYSIFRKRKGFDILTGQQGSGKTWTIINLICLQLQFSYDRGRIQWQKIFITSSSISSIENICHNLFSITTIQIFIAQGKILLIGKLSLEYSHLIGMSLFHISQRILLDKHNKKYLQTSVQLYHQKQLLQLQMERNCMAQNHIKLNIAQRYRFNKIKLKFMKDYLHQNYSQLDRIQKDLINEAYIVIGTLNNCFKTEYRKALANKVNICIIEDAAHALQMVTFNPFRLKCKKVVLVGYQKGMGSKTFHKNTLSNKSHLSLMQRLIQNGYQSLKLKNHYRVLPIEKFFYDKHSITPEFDANFPKGYTFMDVKIEKQPKYAQINIIKRSVIFFYNKYKNRNMSLGIIVDDSNFKNNLQEEFYEDQLLRNLPIKIDKVEDFIGQQRDIMIVWAFKRMQFANSEKYQRRVMQSLSRGKHIVVVVGNSYFLNKNQIWAKYIQYCSDTFKLIVIEPKKMNIQTKLSQIIHQNVIQ